MNRKKMQRMLLQLILFVFIITIYVNGQDDYVAGDIIQFNDNGAWCWYQDERAVVDTAFDVIILGSDASGTGTDGNSRDGRVEGVIFNLGSGAINRSTFRTAGCDDHNVPGFIIRPDGQYLAMYADHYDYYNSRYRIYNGSSWGSEQQFDWESIPGGTNYTIAYSNIYYLSEEGRMYNFARANNRSPNFIVSDNMGDTWQFGGQLSTNNTDSYNKGYYKYWGNGIDKIDFICTEEHPRDGLTSMYHGYIQDGKVFSTNGTMVDDDIYSLDYVPSFEDFTKIFSDGTIVGDDTLRKVWNADLVRYDNGEIAAILTARINNIVSGYGNDPLINPDHGLIYCRYNGSEWSWTYLGQAGKKMYSSEADYVGLGALDPNDPNTIYISTHVDPRDDTELGIREIFKGTTTDNGNIWSWTPVTWNSTRNNYRPIVPDWDEDHTAVLWMRGTYNSAQSFDMAIVGMIERDLEGYGLKTYMDATTSNTTEADNSPFTPTGPDANSGAADDQWHERTDYGNDGSVFTSAEVGGENAPALKTTVKATTAGMIDVWVNFWADPTSDWRIKAGLTESGMQIYRHMAGEQVEPAEHTTALTLTGSSNTYLYQAYVGRLETNADSTFSVYVDDHAIQTGSGSQVGNSARTWYDGISYVAPVYVTIDAEELTVHNTAGSTANFGLLSNTDWDIYSSETWLTPDLTTGSDDHTVILTADENAADSARSATVTVSADNIEDQIVTVYQQPASPSLSVSDTELTIGAAENSTVTFDITSNTNWTVESSEYWIAADLLTGLNNRTVTLESGFNALSTKREAIITVSADGVAPQTITVTQDSSVTFYVVEDSLLVDYEENSTVNFRILSNVSWSVSSDETWLMPDIASGSNTDVVTLTAEGNTTTNERMATVTVTAEGFTPHTIIVNQSANPIESITVSNDDIGYVYPNPTKDKLSVKLIVVPERVSLYTLEGKKMLNLYPENSSFDIDLSNLNKGIYLLQIVSDEQSVIRKIIKE